MTDAARRERLRRLGEGVGIDDVCRADGIDRPTFEAWWAAECAARLPDLDRPVALPVTAPVEIVRDGRGVPHVFAANDRDLFVGYGFAMAQDRLFQMDLRRRRPAGRLAEVLGAAWLEADVLARTMDHPGLAGAEYDRLPGETRDLFDAFAVGVNAAITAAADRLPIEFDLLGYRPEPWTGLDCVRCAVAWRWQLTGRPWVISVPELAKRVLGQGPLYDAFIGFMREADDESIVPAGESTARDAGLLAIDAVSGAGIGGGTARRGTPAGVGAGASSFVGPSVPIDPPAFGAPGVDRGVDPMGGSNNWVVAGSRSRSGKPVIASDPHMPYEASSSFYEIHLSGGSFNTAGAGFVGYPGLTFGRTATLAWAITNNICSQRDLYLESDPGAVIGQREETIAVRGRSEPERLTVQLSRHGPIVDRLLPATAAPSGPVAMRWVGQLACDWPSAQLRLNRSTSVDEGMTAVRGWLSPTFSLLLADSAGSRGHIAFTSTGTIPVRGRPERGFRDGANPADEWLGLIPPEGLPQTRDPASGWIGSANNRPIRDAEYPYPLSGTWDEGFRHRRIGQLVEALGPHDRRTFSRMHIDAHVGRADDNLDAAVAALDAGQLTAVERRALEVLRTWDHNATVDSAGAATWVVFWTRWAQAVSAVRFPAASSDFVATWTNGIAAQMLRADEVGWFASDAARGATIAAAFRDAVTELRAVLGDDPAAWRWGALHHIGLRHPLSAVGDLGLLLDQAPPESGGEAATLNNRGFAGSRIPAGDPGYTRNWQGIGGAGFRLFADLGDPHGSAWTVTLEGQSGNPGSTNRSDQIQDFLAGRYHEVPLDRARAEATARHRLTLTPADDPVG